MVSLTKEAAKSTENNEDVSDIPVASFKQHKGDHSDEESKEVSDLPIASGVNDSQEMYQDPI